MKKFVVGSPLVVGLLTLLLLSASYLLGAAAAGEGPGSPQRQLFQLRSQQPRNLIDRALNMIEANYYMPITPELRQQLVYGALKGMINELSNEPFDDEFSHFYDPDLYKDLNAQTTGEYAGIGVLMGETDDGSYPEVVTVFPGTPAEEAGLLAKDVIARIEDKDAYGMILPEVATAIKGQPGTKVKLRMYRPDTGEFEDYEIERRNVQYSSVAKREVLPGNVGLIEISTFAEDTGKDFRAAMEELTGKGITSLVIDLRNNTGGLLEAAQEVADCFVEEGPIVEVDYRNSQPAVLSADPKSKKYKLPLVILINSSSASASEVLTAALRDYKLATLVGETSFGKGVVQEVAPMERKTVTVTDAQGREVKDDQITSALALTIGKYYTPKREEIHRHGLTPDVYYDIANQLKEDVELQALQKRIEAKAEEMRQLRAEVNRYLRAKDAQKDKAVEVAQRLARKEKIEKVAKLPDEDKDHTGILAAGVGPVPEHDNKDEAADPTAPDAATVPKAGEAGGL